METTTEAGTQKLCPICGKPMTKVHIETARRDYDLSTCVPCVKQSGKKKTKGKG